MTRSLSLFAVFSCGLFLIGCAESGPKIVKVSGTATRAGKPVPSLLIQFQPAKGRPSWGISDAQGKFTLEYDEQTKGAVVGMHTVYATFRASSPEEEGKPLSTLHRDIQQKYADVTKSPMKIELTKAEDNLELKFD